MENHYSYQIKNGTTKGYFNIYQAKSGAIYLQMAQSYTELSLKQIGDLHIQVIDLIDFDHDKFIDYYREKSEANFYEKKVKKLLDFIEREF